MGKKDENYWKDRATEREEYWYKQSRDRIEKDLVRQYRQSAQKIQDDIAALYGRFAKENGLSLKEATALLKGNEFKEWRYTLEEYNHLAQNNNAILKELNTLAMRSRISRLDKLYSQTLMELYKLGEYVEKDMRNFLSDAYRDNYYKGLFEIGKTAGIHGTISAVDNKRLEDVLRTPWSGKNYSARIWDNQKKLAETIKQTVFDSVHRGVSVPKLSKMVQDRMGVGKYEATRLVRTELNYVHNQANLDSIKDSGMEFYKFVATLDSRTSQKCRAHDGSIVPVEDASPGDNIPPLHPHCRSTIIGSLGEGKGGNNGTRAARVGKGKTFYVPQQMKYEDYKAVYVDKSKAFADWAKEAGFKGVGSHSLNASVSFGRDVMQEYADNARPGQGNVNQQEGFRANAHLKEVTTVDKLYTLYGGDFELLDERLTPDEKTPDFMWNGNAWDLKTLSVCTNNAIDRAIRKGLGQILTEQGGLVLDFVTSEFALSKIISAADHRLQRSIKVNTDIIFMHNGQIKSIRRYILQQKKNK